MNFIETSTNVDDSNEFDVTKLNRLYSSTSYNQKEVQKEETRTNNCIHIQQEASNIYMSRKILSCVVKIKRQHGILFKWKSRHLVLDKSQRIIGWAKTINDIKHSNYEISIPISKINDIHILDKNCFHFILYIDIEELQPTISNKYKTIEMQVNSNDMMMQLVKVITQYSQKIQKQQPQFHNMNFVKMMTSDKINIRNIYDIHLNCASGILGTGMTGAVRKIRRKMDGNYFAMKSVKLNNLTTRQLQSLQTEIDILKSLDHPHIAKLYEVYTEKHLYKHLVLEICSGGELFDRLMKKKKFQEEYASILCEKMLSALNYLHTNNIVHRDIKLENWLFRHQEDDSDIVLIDFGLSQRYNKKTYMTSTVGTSYYVAPEVLAGNYQGAACDLWSLGIIIYMLISGTAPYDGINDKEILNAIRIHKTLVMNDSKWKHISNDCKHFIQSLLTVSPKERFTAKQALNHSWITNSKKNKRKHSIPSQTQTTTEHYIDQSIISNLKHFAKYSELKRITIEIVAFHLNHDEIKQLSNLFEDIDIDKNGLITYKELKTVLKQNFIINDDEIQNVFNALDEDHTGQVHLNEFIAGTLQEKYHQHEHYLRDAFTLMDIDNTGYITIANLKSILGTHYQTQNIQNMLSKVKKLAHHHDEKDSDSEKISYEEFLCFIRLDGEKSVDEHYNELTSC